MTAKDRRDDIPVLVVDLDGTLIRSDTLYECFWSSLSETWRTIPAVMQGLAQGRAALKRRLAGMTTLDVDHLPYNQAVLDYIRAWRGKGGRVALVSAADEALVQRVAGHLDLFDEAHGSDGTNNLKGASKADFLTSRFGARGYAYMGDSAADMPVWQASRRAITVDVSPALQAQVAALDTETEALTSDQASAYLKALRPHQWLKNILIFVPLIAAQAYDWAVFVNACLAFAAFSLVSSSGYVLNDLMDLRADRAHPRKSQRPLAAGRVPIAHGTLMVPALLFTGLGLAAIVGPQLLGVIALYFMFTMAYSLSLKRIAIADICTLAWLYTLRIIAGGVATGLGLSVWLLAFSMFFFFAMAAVKRQAELVDLAGRGIPTARRRGYNVDDLPIITQMTTASGFVSVMVLALYLNDPSVQDRYTTPWLLWGICLILLYWISRMVLITHRGRMDDDPIAFAARDRISQICILLMGLCTLGAALL